MNVWLKAAELIETERETYSCHAINEASANPREIFYYSANPTVRRYAALFSPQGDADDTDPWFNAASRKTAKHRRVVALCLMAAITSSNGKGVVQK